MPTNTWNKPNLINIQIISYEFLKDLATWINEEFIAANFQLSECAILHT